MLLRRIFRTVIILILCLLLIINLYIIITRAIFNNNMPKIFGFAQLVIVSGSMQPVLEIGDMIIIKKKERYNLNDIVTYRLNSSIITHRIVELTDTHAILKGDSNNVLDSSIPLTNIEGKVVMRIPLVGNIMFFSRTTIGILFIIIVAYFLIKTQYASKG